TGVAIAMERDYATTHAFAGQVARLAPLLPADGTPRTERMRVAGRFGSESVVAEAWRLRAGDVGLIALRLPSMRRGSPREAVIAFVTDFKLPALAFDAAGTPLAASGGAAALASTPLRDLLGPDTDTSLAAITATGRATIQLVNGPMTLVAVPGADATMAVLAASSEATTVQGLRLVAPVADARAEETAAPAAAPTGDAQTPGSADALEQGAPAEEALAATDTPAAPDALTIEEPMGKPGGPEPAAIKAPEVDPVAPVLEPEPEAGTLAAAPIAAPVQVEAETATGPAPSEAAQKEPQEIAAPANYVDDLAVPQRFSWRLDADVRFHAIAPESVAAPADATFDDAVRRFGLDPQGALAEAVAARRPFSGVPAIWPLGSGGRRLAVTLAAFPTLRDGGFQGYAGFGLIVEELAAVKHATTAAALADVTPADKEPEAEAASDATEEPVVAAPVDAPEAAVNEASDGEAPGEPTPTES
ncbi:MAG: hypothetical protein Q8S29_13800, partial [Phreatobacter sp.]|nr:hypothetical protein [Phreatobacter sp.]